MKLTADDLTQETITIQEAPNFWPSRWTVELHPTKANAFRVIHRDGRHTDYVGPKNADRDLMWELILDTLEDTPVGGGVLSLPEDGAYIIKFDDVSVEDEFIAMGGARNVALERFSQMSGNWNAHLFVKIATNYPGNDCPSATFVPQQPTADPLDAAIAKGTKAWAGVHDSFVEDLRGEGVGQQMTPQGEAAESKPTSDASDLLRLALADAWEHGKADAPFALEGCVAKVSAAFAEPAGREPVYQARVSGSMHAWVDTSEDEFAMTSEDHRRIVYAHPPPVADADQLSTVENIQAFARGYKAHQPKAKLTVHGIAHGLRALETHLAGGQTDA